MAKSIRVRIPGTTANCGPGFDVMGIACTIYNELELTFVDEPGLKIAVQGEGQDSIPLDERNIAYQAVMLVLQRIAWPVCGIVIRMQNNIPLARGLGSSAAAIVGGLVAANHLTGCSLTDQEILDMATSLEGHPDNVAPAIFGGITLCAAQGTHVECLRFLPAISLGMVVAVPDFGLSTKAARQVLPKMVPFRDAVFNIGRGMMLIGALCEGKIEYLQYALDDRIHQPYRQKLIPGMPDVFQAAITQGAYGAVLSGAGPCLIAFTAEAAADAVGRAMVDAFRRNRVSAHYLSVKMDKNGAKPIFNP